MIEKFELRLVLIRKITNCRDRRPNICEANFASLAISRPVRNKRISAENLFSLPIYVILRIIS